MTADEVRSKAIGLLNDRRAGAAITPTRIALGSGEQFSGILCGISDETLLQFLDNSGKYRFVAIGDIESF